MTTNELGAKLYRLNLKVHGLTRAYKRGVRDERFKKAATKMYLDFIELKPELEKRGKTNVIESVEATWASMQKNLG